MASSLPDLLYNLLKQITGETQGATEDLALTVLQQATTDGGLETPSTITPSSGAASLALTPYSPRNYTVTLTQNTALTVTGMSEGQVLNIVVYHTNGPWTLSVNGEDVGLVAASGESEDVTLYYVGAEWRGHVAGVPDVIS